MCSKLMPNSATNLWTDMQQMITQQLIIESNHMQIKQILSNTLQATPTVKQVYKSKIYSAKHITACEY